MYITLDEGYQFGLGLFETVAIECGTPILLEEHLQRLSHSMEFLKIRQAVTVDMVHTFLIKHSLEQKENYTHHALKIMVSSENILMTTRKNPYTDEHRNKGFSLDYSPVLRNETSPLTAHKSFNYGDCLLEKRRAAVSGLDELLFLNTKGQICEGTVSNVFFVRDDRIYTPRLSCGLLPGVMRRFVLEHFSVSECVLTPNDVSSMTECFVTNSLMGIMPVNQLAGYTFPSRLVTQQCIDRYRIHLATTLNR